MKIFSGSSNSPLAKKVVQALKKDLSSLEIHIFPDQEKRVRVVDRVVGEDCIVVQSTSINADKNYMELFFIADALKRSGAGRIIAVIPYLGYQRQDHQFREGEAVSVKVIAEILEKLGISKLIVLDLHSIKIEEAFNIPVSHLSALSIFAKFIKEKDWDKNSTTLISPDMGGIRRIKILSKMLANMPFATVVKNRDLTSGDISLEKIEGGLKKRAIIVDDMISTGSTIIAAAELLAKNGVEEIFVFATHPVFSGDAHKLLQKSKVEKVFVTDTIDVPKEKRFPKLEILSVAEMIADNIKE